MRDPFTFIRYIEKMMPWMHPLDQVNYARGMPVFLDDMKALSSKTKAFYDEFCKGNFTVTNPNRLFSSMGEDQAHEQNKKCIKTDGGAIGLFDTANALSE